jgi:hypothetical protein
MRKVFALILLAVLIDPAVAQDKLKVCMAQLQPKPEFSLTGDWLIDGSAYKAGVYKGSGPNDMVITNGLIERCFRVSPSLACYSFRNLVTGQEMVRAVKPEAEITIDGKDVFAGGLDGQFEFGYLKYEWLDSFTAFGAFQLQDFTVNEIRPYLEWKPVRWIPEYTWPPKGKELTFNMIGSTPETKGIALEIHYEIYDGIPLICKWLEITNKNNFQKSINKVTGEILAFVEEEVSVDKMNQWKTPNIGIASNYSFMGMTGASADRVTNWLTDSTYTSQVNYERKTPCLLVCQPPIGPGISLAPEQHFTSFRIWELIYDSYDRERKGLAERRLYRTTSPWVLENPIFLHLTSTDPAVIHQAVDQCKNTGFEMIILSFGSGLNMESDDTAYIRKFKGITDYCRSNGIELGGYSLLASRRINDDEDVINPGTGKTGDAVFGNSPCLGSNWGLGYFNNLQHFIDATGFSLLEHDGSYPGDVCASTNHPGHRGVNDSQWLQWEKITEFYKWCRSKDIYLNVPDWYFLAGSNKTGIGYRETNWSLPRDRQLVLGRQNIYDGTWGKTPSMGWTFVPLVEYQGGGEEATLEPLSEHLKEYEAHLFQNFGAGVQACYRGFRLYDTEETKQLVSKWVDWYKKYRLILNSDIIHLRRADGRDWDGFMHVNPSLKEKAMVLIFNTLSSPIEREINLPLYYTGLSGSASIREKDEKATAIKLNDKSEVKITVKLPAKGFTWLVVEK